MTFEKGFTQEGFQLLDLVADRALANAELLSGTGEAVEPGNCLEHGQGFQGWQFHYRIFS